MKDYKLSEIKAICESHTGCIDCHLFEEQLRLGDVLSLGKCIPNILLRGKPRYWQIDKEEQDE